jgi:hypothetical protein
MSMLSVTVPFRVPDLFAGLAKGAGIAKATPLELTLQFVVQDSVFEIIKTNVKEIRIPRAEIESIKLRRGLFIDKLIIRVKSLALLQDLPGCDNCDITLRLARRDRNQAADLVLLLGGAPSR